MPMVLPSDFGAHQTVTLDIAVAPQRPVRLDDALRQGEHHADRVLGHGMRVAAGLIDHQHTRSRAGRNIDRIEAGAVARHQQQVRRAFEQVLVDVEMRREFVPRRTDLIDMRGRQDRRVGVLRAFVLEPVEPHVGARLQDVDVDRVRQIFDVEDALAVHGHYRRHLGLGKFGRSVRDRKRPS